MDQEKKEVVLAIITNKERNVFYMQQKDETYFRTEYRLMFTFFGGKIEDSENPNEAIQRELLEEFDSKVAEIIIKNLKFVFSIPYENKKEPKKFQIFESILSNEEINLISKTKIKEGKKGLIIKKESIESTQIIPLIKMVLDKYLKLIQKSK